ncbi:MBL fold metallo-hydrolase [Chloroflexota bacterium]
MEVTPGIYQLKVPIPDNPLGHLNAYLIEGDNGWLLVDTGWNTQDAFDSLNRQLAELNTSIEDITTIVVTHNHADHYGLASRVKQASGAQLAMHRIDDQMAQDRFADLRKVWQRIGHWLVLNGMPAEDFVYIGSRYSSEKSVLRIPIAPADIAFSGGEKISTGSFDFDVLWTPGHSRGHICLHETTKKILISGDHVLPVITPHISCRGDHNENPLAQYIDSLKMVENLDVDIVLPAHEHIFYDLKERVGQILEHHEQRMEAIFDNLGDVPKTGYEIASQVSWMPEEKEGGLTWDELDPSQRPPASMEALAHLQLMFSEGRVEKVVKDDITFFQVV